VGADDIAREVGIYDFYAIHVISYCEGYFQTKTSATGDFTVRNVSSCSNRTVLFHFDPSDVLSRELNAGVNLSDLNWSDAIDDDFQVLSVTTKTMAVLYCIGTGATGLAFLAGAWLVFAGGRNQAITELFLSMVSHNVRSTSRKPLLFISVHCMLSQG
jgi:SUR7/PalI family.